VNSTFRYLVFIMKCQIKFIMLSLTGWCGFALISPGHLRESSHVSRGLWRQASSGGGGIDHSPGAWGHSKAQPKVESDSYRAWAEGGDYGPGAWARTRDKEKTAKPVSPHSGSSPGKRERMKAWVRSKVKPKAESDFFRAWAEGGDYGPGAWARSKDEATAPAVETAERDGITTDGGESPGKRDRVKAWAKLVVKDSAGVLRAWGKPNAEPAPIDSEAPVTAPISPTVPSQAVAQSRGGGGGRDYGIGAWARARENTAVLDSVAQASVTQATVPQAPAELTTAVPVQVPPQQATAPNRSGSSRDYGIGAWARS